MALLDTKREEEEKLLDEQQEPDHAAPLRADVLGTIAGANPNDPGYLGKIDKMITAHGALENASPDTMQPAYMSSSGGAPPTPTATPDSSPPMMGEQRKHGLLGRIGHVAARMGNIAGDILAPDTMALIPGTDLNKQITANRAAKQSLADREVTARETTAGAEAKKADTEAAKQRFAETQTPKIGQTPEETTIHDLMTGEQGQPRINPQTQKLYTYLEAYAAVKQAAQDVKPDKAPPKESFEEQTYAEWLKTHPNGTRLEFDKERKQATATPRQPTEREEWMKDHPGASMDDYWAARAAAPANAKAAAGEDAGKAAQQYANDYMASGEFTASGDEALMEKYFELAKPSSGFRMTQPQLEMLQKGRDLMGGLKARAKHLLTPDAPWFSDTQREQIVNTMKDLQRARDEVKASKSGGGGPTAQSKWQKNDKGQYRYSNDGGKTWNTWQQTTK